MLTLTENASTIVKDITTQPGLAETAGLRITAEQESAEPTFAVSAAESAEPGDKTLEQDGAKVYLDEGAAVLLEDKVLDAAVDPEGRVEFALGLQG